VFSSELALKPSAEVAISHFWVVKLVWNRDKAETSLALLDEDIGMKGVENNYLPEFSLRK